MTQRPLITVTQSGKPLGFCPKCQAPSTDFHVVEKGVRKKKTIWRVGQLVCKCGEVINEERYG